MKRWICLTLALSLLLAALPAMAFAQIDVQGLIKEAAESYPDYVLIDSTSYSAGGESYLDVYLAKSTDAGIQRINVYYQRAASKLTRRDVICAPIPIVGPQLSKEELLKRLVYDPPYFSVDGLSGVAELLCAPDEKIFDLSVWDEGLIAVVQKGDASFLRIAPWDGKAFSDVVSSKEIYGNVRLEYHASYDSVILSWWIEDETFAYEAPEEDDGFDATSMSYISADFVLSRTDTAAWTLTQVVLTGEGYDLNADSISTGNYQLDVDGWLNSDVYYGVPPWQDLRTLDFSSIPLHYEDALPLLNREGLAVTRADQKNNETPLYAARDAAEPTYIVYDRTPLHVLETADGWARVRLGTEAAGDVCWVRTENLVMGEAMDTVKCGFPEVFSDDAADIRLLGSGALSDHDYWYWYYFIGRAGEKLLVMTKPGEVGIYEGTPKTP